MPTAPVRSATLAAVIVAGALALTGCPAEEDPGPPTATPTDATPTAEVTPDADAESPADPYADIRDAVATVGGEGLARAAGGGLAAGDLAGDPDADAVHLRTRLVTNLRSHAHLTAQVAEAGRVHGTDSPRSEAAVAALDATVRELTDIVADLAGTSAGAAFHDAWSELTGALLDGDDPESARQRLVAAADDATGDELDAGHLASLLEEQTDLLADAVTASSDGDEAAYPTARDAAAAARRTADELARALVAAHELEGDPDSAVATAQADLAGALVDDAHLILSTAVLIQQGDLDSPRFVAATGSLDRAATMIAGVLDRARSGSGSAVLERWREGTGISIDLARAEAAGDDVLADRLRADLVARASAAADALASALGGAASADELRELLEERARALGRAVRGVAPR